MNSPSAFRLPVAPLPACPENGESFQTLPEGFVDEQVIASLLADPFARPSSRSRTASTPSDLVLSADENDFAGWSVRPASPFRAIAEHQERPAVRPAPPETEPGIGHPHRGSHRWWIAAVAGISSAMIVSALFHSFGAAPESDFTFLSKSFAALQSAIGSLTP